MRGIACGREVGDGDGWPGMGQVVRSPAESAGEEDGGHGSHG